MNEMEIQQLEIELAKTRRALIAATTALEDYQSTTAAQRAQIESLTQKLETEKSRGDLWYRSYKELTKENEGGDEDNA